MPWGQSPQAGPWPSTCPGTPPHPCAPGAALPPTRHDSQPAEGPSGSLVSSGVFSGKGTGPGTLDSGWRRAGPPAVSGGRVRVSVPKLPPKLPALPPGSFSLGSVASPSPSPCPSPTAVLSAVSAPPSGRGRVARLSGAASSRPPHRCRRCGRSPSSPEMLDCFKNVSVRVASSRRQWGPSFLRGRRPVLVTQVSLSL